jgi:Mg-chelatase subunit ChlD
MGGLARFIRGDRTLLNWLELTLNPTYGGVASTEGALWFDARGNLVRHEFVCPNRIFPKPTPTKGVVPYRADNSAYVVTGPQVPQHSEWIPAKGLGDLEVLCGPTFTPTPTRTVTPSPTWSPTPTQTREPEPIYLPALLDESCSDRQLHADIVLVIDASTSMRRLTSANRPKLEAVQEAAKQFLDLMDFDPAGGSDKLAVVGFNHRAWIETALTSDAPLVGAAIDGLGDRMAEGTRLDLALSVGMEALAPVLQPDRGPDVRNPGADGNVPVIVLLTDGLPNMVPTPEAGGSQEDTVLAYADQAHARGIALFTIGVGRPDAADLIDRINSDLLRAVATDPSHFYQTPDAEELKEIYSQVALTIACPRGRHNWATPWP